MNLEVPEALKVQLVHSKASQIAEKTLYMHIYTLYEDFLYTNATVQLNREAGIQD